MSPVEDPSGPVIPEVVACIHNNMFLAPDNAACTAAEMVVHVPGGNY